MENDKINIRVIFAKEGRARFISHLDLNRCMQRAIKRSGIPIWYTMGYNPHLYIMFPLPLTLGLSSVCEIMDIGITEEMPMSELTERLNAAMPEGLRIISAAPAVMKHTEIAAAEYRAEISCPESDDLAADFRAFLDRESIMAEKFSKKKGTVEVDIKPDIALVSAEGEGESAVLDFRLPAGSEKSLNAPLVMEAFEKYSGRVLSRCSITRTKIICKNGEIFL